MVISAAVQEAVRPVTSAQVGATGKTLATYRHSVGAAWVEAAASGRVNEAGNLTALWPTSCTLLVSSNAVRIRCRGNKQLRVRMFGALDNILAGTAFNSLAGVHHKRILGEVARAGYVMGDEEQRELVLVFKTQQQVQYVQTYRDIEH